MGKGQAAAAADNHLENEENGMATRDLEKEGSIKGDAVVK